MPKSVLLPILFVLFVFVGAFGQAQVVNPVLDFSTYLGGSGDDMAYAVTTDSTGAIYVAGVTQSSDFPISGSAFQFASRGGGDIFVTKISATGAVVYSTYVGGSAADGDIAGYVGGIAVDSYGNAYVTGVNTSSDFPITPNSFQPTFGSHSNCDNGIALASCGEAFIFKLNASGSALIYSTFLGGSADDEGKAITIDATGAAYVTGTTTSSDFPVTAGVFQRSNHGAELQTEDAFVSKISSDGSSLIYSTLIGGSGDDLSLTIAVDAAGRAVIGGMTNSPDFPVRNAIDAQLDDAWDAFVAKVSPDGSNLEFSTLLGGEGTQQVLGLALDTVGDIYLAGFTTSADFPIVNAFQPGLGGGRGNGFVTKLRADGGAILYSTFLGGQDGLSALNAITVNARGEAFVSGMGGADFPVVNSVRPCGGNGDAVSAKLTPDGTAVYWSSFFGGADYDIASAIALDPTGEVIIAGQTASADLTTGWCPTSAFCWPTWDSTTPQQHLAGITDAFLARFADPAISGPILSTPKLIQMGDTYVGSSDAFKPHRISNPGTSTLHIAQVVPSSNVTVNTDCLSVDPARSCTLNVSLKPAAAASVSGTIAIYDDAPDSPQTITVRGTGIYGGDLELVSLTAGNVYLNSGQPTFPMTALVRNNGPNDAGSVILRISNNLGGTDCNPCGLGTLKSGATTTLRFNRTSNVFGNVPVTATVVASSSTPDLNPANDSQTIQVAVPLYTASPAELTFAAQAVNAPSTRQRILFNGLGFGPFRLSFASAGDFAQTNNCGQTDDNDCYIDIIFNPTAAGTRTGILTIYESTAGTTQSIPITGAGVLAPYASFSTTTLDFGPRMIGRTSSARIVTLTNAGSAAMQIAPISVYGDFAQAHNCPATLNASASCNISVTFTPLGPSTRAATLLIQDNAAGNPHPITLTGIGSTSAADITPSSLDFFGQRVSTSSTAQAVTITNISGNLLRIPSVTAAAGFQQTNNCTTLQPDASCTINVVFLPNQMGSINGTLQIATDGAGSPHGISLWGFGLQSVLHVEPLSLEFMSVAVGVASPTQFITLTNIGNSTLLFTSIGASGDFSLSGACDSALGPGETCQVGLLFRPTQAGMRIGQLVIASDASQTANAVSLSGTGYEIVVSTTRPSRTSRELPEMPSNISPRKPSPQAQRESQNSRSELSAEPVQRFAVIIPNHECSKEPGHQRSCEGDRCEQQPQKAEAAMNGEQRSCEGE